MHTLKTKTTFWAAVAITLLFAAIAGAATVYVHRQYRKAAVIRQQAVAHTHEMRVEYDSTQYSAITVQKPVEKPSKSAKLPARSLAIAPASVSVTIGTTVQDHCINIPGVQASLPEGMGYDSTGNCFHIPTQAEIDAEVAANKASAEAFDAAQEAQRQSQVDGLNKQIADLDAAYMSGSQTNIVVFRAWQAKRNLLIAQRDQIQYAQLK